MRTGNRKGSPLGIRNDGKDEEGIGQQASSGKPYLRKLLPGAILWRLSSDGGELEKLGETAGLMHMHRFLIHPDGRQALFQTQLGRTELWAIGNFLPKLSAAR